MHAHTMKRLLDILLLFLVFVVVVASTTSKDVNLEEDAQVKSIIDHLNHRVNNIEEKIDDVHDVVKNIHAKKSSLRKQHLSRVYDDEAHTYLTPISSGDASALRNNANTKRRANKTMATKKQNKKKQHKVIVNNGEKISLCASGGGARANVALWAILKKYGKSFLQQAPLISTNSGSSWFINQLLFSNKSYLDEDATSKEQQYTFEEIVNQIYNVNKNIEHGHDVVSAKAPGTHGLKPSTAGETSPAWISHISQAISKKDGWKSIVDEVNKNAKNGNGVKGAKYNINWYQGISLLANGIFDGEKYRFCPFENEGRIKNKNGDMKVGGKFKFENGACKFCPNNKKCNVPFEKAPTSMVYEYDLLINGKKTRFPSIPAMAYRKQTKDDAAKFDVIIPLLEQAEKIEIEFGPLFGRSNKDKNNNKFFKFHDGSNNMKNADKLKVAKTTITYDDIREHTAKYFDYLWNHHREGLSAISSSAGGIFNSRRYVQDSVTINPPGMKLPSFMVTNIIKGFFNKDFNARTGEPLTGGLHMPPRIMKQGMKGMISYFLTNGLNGMYPSIGAATSIEVPSSTSSVAKLSWVDGGMTDNFGIGSLLYDMQRNNNYHPFVLVASMESYKALNQYFTHDTSGAKTPDMAHGSFGGFVKYDKTDLRMLSGSLPKGPPEECVQDTLTAELKEPGKCGLFYVMESEYTIVGNKYFGLKTDNSNKVKVIFLLYNEGDMSMLPGKGAQKKFAKSASKLVNGLDQSGLIRIN
jgi:hypothetical protein